VINAFVCQVQGVQGEDGPDVRDATVRPGVHRAEHERIRGTGKIWVKTMRWQRSTDIPSTDGFFCSGAPNERTDR